MTKSEKSSSGEGNLNSSLYIGIILKNLRLFRTGLGGVGGAGSEEGV